MIIEFIIDALVRIIKSSFAFINIPDFPVEVEYYINKASDIIVSGFEIIGLFLDLDYVASLVGIVVIIVNIEHIYHFIMWILRKLPIGVE